MTTSFPVNLPPVLNSAPFIVIGSGIAGLYSALELSKQHSVILITKSNLFESNTNYAQGGIAAAMGSNDSPELHYQDTMMAGAGLCDPDAVRILVYDGPARVKNLIKLGVPFDRDQKEISLTREAAHSRRRILHADGDATGREVAKTLINQVYRSEITVYENTYALALVTDTKGHCRGVIVLEQGNLHLILGSAVILCTGGLGQIYGKTTNPSVATGDGMILAYNAGGALRDLEFIQFHPTALYLPPAPPFLISEAVRGEGAILINSSGDRFMPGYHSLAELAPRDIVARSIFEEIQKTNSSCVYLDLSKIKPAAIKSRFPNIYLTCLNYGLDITTDLIPVAPAAHYAMGGILTDYWGRTTVPGLYAAGEAASTGVHGANRLASNSLLEGLVFAGRIIEYLGDTGIEEPKKSALSGLIAHYPRLFNKINDYPGNYRRLHEVNDRFLGIMREHTGLNQATSALRFEEETDEAVAILAEAGLETPYLELQNMYQLTKLILQAALARTESRGGHFRSDYPVPDPKWRNHIVFKQEQMEVTKA
ncbi:MAG TPA: L-aspartate oxidase [Bacillota bacterium]|nr:L-aspartate oxidase [Bacillota bacterium]